MKEDNLNKLKKIAFAIAFILSCFNMNSNHLSGYLGGHGTKFLIFKFSAVIIFMIILTCINKSNIAFISKLVKITLWTMTPVVIFDYFVTKFSGSQFLIKVWWLAFIVVACATVFLTITFLKPKDYNAFYYDFWKGLTPIYIFTLILCFIRIPGSGVSANLKLGNGTFLLLKTLIEHPDVDTEIHIIFFGNILVFLPLSFVISSFIKKIKPYQLSIIGLIAPFIAEGYQYFLKCGDVDIDDIVLNWLGYFIGMGIYYIIKKRLLTKSE